MTDKSETTPDWPPGLTKPDLPLGYEWVCLRPALGMRNEDGVTHPWWIRLYWTMPSRRKRYIDMPDYYSKPEEAIQAAVEVAFSHARKREHVKA
jgi:hypothetical protein